MTQWFLWSLAIYGLSTAIAVLKIGDFVVHPITDRCGLYVKTLFRCPACLAFWIGMGASWLVFSPCEVFLLLPKWKAIIMDGLGACGTAYLLHSLAEHLDPTEE